MLSLKKNVNKQKLCHFQLMQFFFVDAVENAKFSLLTYLGLAQFSRYATFLMFLYL